jgi:hypothetical protein
MSAPFSKMAPARTRATRCGPFTELIAQRDQGKTKVFVINLDGAKPPEYMRYLQYITPAQHPGAGGIVDIIVAEVGREGAA